MSLGKLKILHIFDHSLPIYSGYSFRSLSLLRQQRQRGWTTCHLTTPRHTAQGPPCEAVDGFQFHRTEPPVSLAANLPWLSEAAEIRAVARRIAELAAAEQPDILHAHSPVLNVLAALLANRRLDLPIVYEVRGFWEDAAASHGTAGAGGPRYRLTRALDTYAFRNCDAITAICEGLRQDIIGRGIAPDRITLIPNGVDPAEFDVDPGASAALRSSLQLDGKLVLGFLGSFYEYEGLEDLLAALPAVLVENPQTVLLLAGGGQVEERLKQQSARLGIEHAVRFLGRIPHEKVPQYYGAVDIFVYPRRPMRLTETVTPLKPLEAMARRGIVLASDVGGHRELITDRSTGYMYRAGDIDALIMGLKSVIAARAEWPEIAARARRFIENERSWAATTAGYTSAYSRALQKRARTQGRAGVHAEQNHVSL